ncbi:MAG: hypothetical protein KDD40_06950 [Bdellovibrionales bacterium]|nr:hypothetical protein [Bdellovibrionales bacterium]
MKIYISTVQILKSLAGNLSLKAFLIFLFPIIAIATETDSLSTALSEMKAFNNQYIRDRSYDNESEYIEGREELKEGYRILVEAAKSRWGQTLPDGRAHEFSFHFTSYSLFLLETTTSVRTESAGYRIMYAFRPEEIIGAMEWNKNVLKLFMREIEQRLQRGELNLQAYVTNRAEALIILQYLERWKDSMSSRELKENIYALSVKFKEYDLRVPENFARMRDAIVNSTDGSGYWAWEYVLNGDTLHYRPQFVPITGEPAAKRCARLLSGLAK